MKVFVTGANGYVGNAVAAELTRSGHEVFGLVRTQEKGRVLEADEIRPVVGDMADPGSWAQVARSCQAMVHCAAEYSERFHDLDRATVDALLQAARSANAPRLVVYTSGVWLYGDTGDGMADEASNLVPPAMVARRVETERAVLGASGGGIRSLVLRPGCLYGGRGGLTGAWFASALEGAPRVIGDGRNRWAMVHVADVADAYRRAVESPFSGEVFNIVDRSRFTVRECAEAAARAIGIDTDLIRVPVADATTEMGAMAECLTLNQHVGAGKASRLLGWQPRHGGFVDGATRCALAWRAHAGA
jgi:nucleoside-diphosphate-sugar epimerase